MPNHARPQPVLLLLALFILAASGCTAAATPASSPSAPPSQGASPTPGATVTPAPTAAPTVSPTQSASPTPGSGEISHPTDPSAVVLRYEVGGEFVPPSFLATQVPAFTLYGDGTVTYRPSTAEMPPQKEGDPVRYPPLQIARLTEDQVQLLLADALSRGGLAVARLSYANDGIADAPTSYFTVDAGATRKRIEIYALGIDANANPDAAILGQMAGLADRLANFDKDVAAGKAAAAGVFHPTRYRGSLLNGGPGNPPKAWPWSEFGPESFIQVQDDPGRPLPSRVLSSAEAAKLGIPDIDGGASGIMLDAGGQIYELGLRPLLPDEQR